MKTCWRARALGLVGLVLLGLANISRADWWSSPLIWGPGPGLFQHLTPNVPSDPTYGFVPTTWRTYPQTPVGPNGTLQWPSISDNRVPRMPRADEDKNKDKAPLLPTPTPETPMSSETVPSHYRVVGSIEFKK